MPGCLSQVPAHKCMQHVEKNMVSYEMLVQLHVLTSWKCGGMAPMMGVLQRKDTDFLGRARWEGKERKLTFI